MKNIAGNIVRRLLVIIVFLGCGAVICCGISKSHSNAKAVVCNGNGSCCKENCAEDIRPSQLVSIRIMQLI
ncbi:MAG TPA: hypothetical protein VN958_12135 [Chitinophagaceae bacterium]|nr:hypothetical protein [Chitinophagaceae bacterium]